MNWIDWLLITLVVLYAVSGYWQGFVTGAFATLGLLLGGALGIWLAPKVLGEAGGSVWVSLGALFLVVICASAGQVGLQWVGVRVRDRISWHPVRALDAVGGAILAACAVLLVGWALGVAISGASISALSKTVRASVVLRAVDSVLPESAPQALEGFNNLVGTSLFPRYLEPFAPERINPVAAGPAWIRQAGAVTKAGESVVKIYGDNACGSGVEGTGWVVADGYVVTNAHVVAGVGTPSVLVGVGQVAAQVVGYDPRIDLAVLHVDTGGMAPLPMSTEAGESDPVAILGFPNDGPFDIQAGRIRSQQKLRSPDIYGQGASIREVFSLRGLVRPGNSGGPVLDKQGRVVGVVFAASLTDADTGYALTAEQTSDLVDSSVGSTSPVSTGGCL